MELLRSAILAGQQWDPAVPRLELQGCVAIPSLTCMLWI